MAKLEDGVRGVRYAALEALSKLPAEVLVEGKGAIVARLEHEDAAFREAAREVLPIQARSSMRFCAQQFEPMIHETLENETYVQ